MRWQPILLGRTALLCITFFVFNSLLFAQQNLLPDPDTSNHVPRIPGLFDQAIPMGYDSYSKRTVTGATSTVSLEEFNQGLISDLTLLIQGKMAGVQVYNRGGDPNLMSQIRIRGLSAFSQKRPLVVVDGIPGASLQNLDPNDVASVTILKDGSAQAIYGIRASNGVILITTKNSSNTDEWLSVSYTGQLAASIAHSAIPVMTAGEFRETGGVDLGASTDWLEEVMRDGIAHTHGLALTGKRGHTNYRLSGNYRNVEGVLRKSGFEQVNIRANLSSKFLQEALELNISASYTDRNSQLGFNEAFRYAVSYNPTAPVLAEDAPFPFNTKIFGGYFETIGLFDSFNPKAIVDLNERNGKLQVLTTAALLKYNINPEFSINFRHAYQDQFLNERAYYSPQSLFRGNAYQPDFEEKGRADLQDDEDSFSLYELFGTYNKTFGQAKLGLTVGTAYQDGDHQDHFLQLEGFSNEKLVDTKRIGDYQNWEAEAMRFDTVNNGWSDKLSAFFGRANLNVEDKFFFSTSLRYEGSSKLGANKKWGLFPAFGAAVDISKFSTIPAIDQLKFRLGYGVTGGIPDRGGLAQEKIVLVQQADSTFVPEVDQAANPDLKWEEKREWNVGLDFQVGKLTGYIEWYTRKVKDWISLDNFEFFTDRYANQNSLKTNGVEIGLDMLLFDQPNYSYATGVLFSSYQSKYEELAADARLAAAPCCGTLDPLIPLREGEDLGNLYAPQYMGTVDGNPIFADINNDGSIDPNNYPSIFDDGGDFIVAGNGIPDFELGWKHQFHFRGWQLHAFFRGAFGHSLVNKQRVFYEPRPSYFNNNYNLVNTELAVEELHVSRYSSLYVEKANFFKLDYVTISKIFSLGPAAKKNALKVSLTAQNLLVLTNYTGADPKPVLEDPGPTTNGSEVFIPEGNPLAPGIDRRNYYLPAKTFVLGIGLEF